MPLSTVTNGQVSDASQLNAPINLLNLMRGEQTVTETVLVSGVDASVAENVYVTLTANRVIGAPLNPVAGQRLHFVFTENGTGGWTVTWNAAFSLTNWALNTAANAKTEATFSYIGSTWVVASNPPLGNIAIVPAPSGGDDSATILAKINALPATGGTLLFQSGTYNCNMVDTPLSATKAIIFEGAGLDATILKGNAATDHVLSLRCNGEVRDLTVDGNAQTTNGISYVTDGSVTIDTMALRRVKVKNINTATSGWVFVANDSSNAFKITNLWLEDVIFDGPSSTVNDAFSVAFVDTTYIKNLLFRNLYRSPNFYAGKRLIGSGLYVVGITHTNCMVLDSNLLSVELSEVWVDSTSAEFLINAGNAAVGGGVRINSSNFDCGVGVNGADNPIDVQFGGGTRFTQYLTSRKQSTTLLAATGCFFKPAAAQSSGIVSDIAPGGGTIKGMKLTGNTFDLTNETKFIGSSAGNTWTNSQVEDNLLLNGTPAVYNIVRGTGFALRNNRGYNPQAGITTPGFPATTVAATNTAGVDVMAYIVNGANALTVQVDSDAALMVVPASQTCSVLIPAGSTFTPTYGGGAPTWKWKGN